MAPEYEARTDSVRSLLPHMRTSRWRLDAPINGLPTRTIGTGIPR
jgi:hypothetical protein